jgi:TonB family protein
MHNAPGASNWRNRATVVRVQLDRTGSLVDCSVLQPSGLDYLDDEAVGAFRSAQPFLGAPLELVETDGYIYFNFAFVFDRNGYSFKSQSGGEIDGEVRRP